MGVSQRTATAGVDEDIEAAPAAVIAATAEAGDDDGKKVDIVVDDRAYDENTRTMYESSAHKEAVAAAKHLLDGDGIDSKGKAAES